MDDNKEWFVIVFIGCVLGMVVGFNLGTAHLKASFSAGDCVVQETDLYCK